MRKALHIAALSLLVLQFCSFAGIASEPVRDSVCACGKKFRASTLVYKGEKMCGAGAVYANLDSRNSEFLLILNNLSASGKIFRISPQFVYAYRDNASVGFRFAYSTANCYLDAMKLSLLSEELSFELDADTPLRFHSYNAGAFHRNYFGFDRRGTVGIFFEERFAYVHNDLRMGGTTANKSNQLKLVFSPGLVLYILPFVSVEASVSLADLSCTFASSVDTKNTAGSRFKFAGGARVNLSNVNFCINYHF